MSIAEVKGDNYEVHFDSESATVYFSGEIALGGPKDYAPIVNLLEQSAAQAASTLTLHLQALAFLNSSGISMLSKFVLGMRKNRGTQLVVVGSKKMPWQSKSLKNLERLLPGLKLVVE